MFWHMEIPERYKVMDIAALAEYLGYKPSTVRTYITRKRWKRIPQPRVQLTVGPVWYVGDVEEWRKSHNE